MFIKTFPLASSFLLAVSTQAQLTPLTKDPVCAKFSHIITKERTSTIVDSDNDISNAPDVADVLGDLIIAEYAASTPITQTPFTIRQYEYQSMCTVTESGRAAPSCDIEVDLTFCFPSPVVGVVIELIDVDAGGDGDGDVLRVEEEPSKYGDFIFPPEDSFVEETGFDGGRRLRGLLRTTDGITGSVDVVDVDDADAVCKIGRFTATGTGPKPYAITGGTGDLFGAFGEWDGIFDVTTGDIIVDMTICFYDGGP